MELLHAAILVHLTSDYDENCLLPLQCQLTHLVLRHGSHNKRADHPGQGAHAVGDSHQDAGVARSDVQVVHVETCRDRSDRANERVSDQSESCTPPPTAPSLGRLTRYCESAEAHRQHQERDGHAFTVGVAHHQQQRGLHAEACGDQGSEVKQRSEVNSRGQGAGSRRRCLTSAVHDFAHRGGGHDVVGAQVVGQLPTQGDDDGHDQVRERRHDSHLRGRANQTYREKKSRPSLL